MKQTLNLATVTMPISLSLLEELELGEWKQGEVVDVQGEAKVCMELIYAGRKVATRYKELDGKLAIKPLVEAVTSGEKLPGFALKRTHEIDHWKLYVELGLSESHQQHADETFEQWFTEQLNLLELSSMEELDMFSEEDFPFEGIPYWEYEDFSQSFPFELALGNLNLDVEYYCSKKLVHVVYRDGLRKEDPKRWELPKWGGWRVQYRKSSRIIDVR